MRARPLDHRGVVVIVENVSKIRAYNLREGALVLSEFETLEHCKIALTWMHSAHTHPEESWNLSISTKLKSYLFFITHSIIALLRDAGVLMKRRGKA